MTEYEIVDLLNSTASVVGTNVSIYLTIVSAYLIVAYTAGNDLSKSQLFIVSTLFLAAAEFFAGGAYASAVRASFIAAELNAMVSDYPLSFPKWAGVYLLLVLQLGIIMSFKFMVDSRGGKKSSDHGSTK